MMNYKDLKNNNLQKIKEEIPDYFREFLYLSKNNVAFWKSHKINSNSLLTITNIWYDKSILRGSYVIFCVDFYDVNTNTIFSIKKNDSFSISSEINKEVEYIRSTFRFYEQKGKKYQRNLGTKYEEVQRLKQEQKKEKDNA